MVKSDIISATKANRLYWLGRYECRVYLTLHQLNKCFDEMIDGEPDDYTEFWSKLDATGIYKTNEEFTFGMLYDDTNPCSVLSAQKFAMDNAILLREDIMSETLSYLEMSVALLKKCKQEATVNISHLQPVIDWALAFWGSAEQVFDRQNNDFGWAHLPKSFMNQNTVFLLLTAMAANFYRYIVALPLMAVLFGIKATDRVKSFLFRFIAVPAKWIRTARQYKLNIYSNKPYNIIWEHG